MEKLILDKARELFTKYGLKSISMEDLAKQSGVSKKTLYQFFEDKNEIILRVVNELIDCHSKLLSEFNNNSKDAIEEVLLQSREPYQTWSSIHPSFFYELEKFFPECYKILMKHQKEVLMPLILSNIQRGIQSGLYRKDINEQFVADLRIQQLYTALQPRLFTTHTTDSNTLIRDLTNFYLYGIINSKGKEILNIYIKNKEAYEI